MLWQLLHGASSCQSELLWDEVCWLDCLLQCSMLLAVVVLVVLVRSAHGSLLGDSSLVSLAMPYVSCLSVIVCVCVQVRCVLLTTTSDNQLTLVIRSIQLDNQLLETRHPVVLSPSPAAPQTAREYTSGSSQRYLLTTDKMIEDLDNPSSAAAAGRNGTAAAGQGTGDREGRDGGGAAGAAAGGQGGVVVSTTGSSIGALQQEQPLVWLSVCQLLNSGASTPGAAARAAAQTAAAAGAAIKAAAMPTSDTEKNLEMLGNASAAASGQPIGHQSQLQRNGSEGGGDGGCSSSGNSPKATAQAMSKAAIIPYKKVELQLGPLDLETDQVCLEQGSDGLDLQVQSNGSHQNGTHMEQLVRGNQVWDKMCWGACRGWLRFAACWAELGYAHVLKASGPLCSPALYRLYCNEVYRCDDCVCLKRKGMQSWLAPRGLRVSSSASRKITLTYIGC